MSIDNKGVIVINGRGNMLEGMSINMQESYTLEHTCGGVSPGQPSGRLLALLTSFILPLCIRVGCGRQG